MNVSNSEIIMDRKEIIEENNVRYCLYPKLAVSNEEQDEQSHQNYINDSLVKLADHLSNYYWYYTPFNLRYVDRNSSHSKVNHIEGCTNFDENIQDEWFIAFLLYELSRHDPDLVIQLEDSDGYFLLIETADYLPKWVNPKNSLNRCYIYRGQLHLISIEHNIPSLNNQRIRSKHESVKNELKPKSPTIEQAIELIRDPKVQTCCSNEIQNHIKQKLSDYPDKIFSSMHRCRAIVPSSIAFLLEKEPKLICHAIRAFYNRDDLDLAACRLMKHFQPDRLVQRIVKLNRFNYAQLQGQNFKPDFKLNWHTHHQSTVIASSTATCSTDKQYNLGFKISCGFEILVSDYKKTAHSNETSSGLSRQTVTNWKAFLSNLKRRNYFDNLIEQSSEYKERLANARQYFENSRIATVTSASALIEHSQIGRRICELLEGEYLNCEQVLYERYKKEELSLPDEDTDDWLSEVPDFLLNSEKNSNFDDLPTEITNSLQEFIKSDSDYKGVEQDCGLDTKVKKHKSDLKERAFRMMSNNLRSIITMKVSDSESDHSETDLSDYNYTSASSDDEEINVKDELKYMKQSLNKNKKREDRPPRERKKRPKIESTSSSTGEKDIKQLMDEMDEELAGTTIGKSFEKLSIKPKNVPMANCAEFDDYSEEEESALNDADVEYNTVKNLLSSFKEQNGLSGPTSTILDQLGVRLPKDVD